MTSTIDIPVKITTDKQYTKMRATDSNGNTSLHFNVLWSDNSTTVEPLINFIDNEEKSITDKLVPHLYHYKIIADSRPKNINKCWLCKNFCPRGVRVAKCLCTNCFPNYGWIFDIISEYKPMQYKRKRDPEIDDLISKFSRSSIDDIISTSIIELKTEVNTLIDKKESEIKMKFEELLLESEQPSSSSTELPAPPPTPNPSSKNDEEVVYETNYEEEKGTDITPYDWLKEVEKEESKNKETNLVGLNWEGENTYGDVITLHEREEPLAPAPLAPERDLRTFNYKEDNLTFEGDSDY